MRRLDGYLSTRAQRLYPSALIYQEEDDSYTLERADAAPLTIGRSFSDAQRALIALRNAQVAE